MHRMMVQGPFPWAQSAFTMILGNPVSEHQSTLLKLRAGEKGSQMVLKGQRQLYTAFQSTYGRVGIWRSRLNVSWDGYFPYGSVWI